MKRIHVLAVTFLAGLVCGCAVPAHAEDKGSAVCTIHFANGETGYQVYSNGSEVFFSPGNPSANYSDKESIFKSADSFIADQVNTMSNTTLPNVEIICRKVKNI